MSLRTSIRSIISKFGDHADLTDAQDVFATGVISSLCLLELICCIEDTFGIVVSQRDVFDGHLRSVDSLVQFVTERQP
jgi:acyl carrier protein